MKNIELVIFDLSGTTVEDNNAVAKSLHTAALECGLSVDLKVFQETIGTNKVHLYQYLLAQQQGYPVKFGDFETYDFPDLEAEAMSIFSRYTVIMLEYYRKHVRAMPGAEETFQWCRDKGLKVATDTGFHRDINNAIIESLGWAKKNLIDLAVHVENTGGVGRPAPYMIFYAMQRLGIQRVQNVVKVGDTPADLLSGTNAGCAGNIGVLSGANSIDVLGRVRHTHIVPSVADLPHLLENEF
jgi:phosphonatase-like hydrolase